MMRWLDGITDSMDMSLGVGDGQGGLACCSSWGCKELTIRKDPDGGRDWGQEEKGTTDDEMAGWHHRLDRHEFE